MNKPLVFGLIIAAAVTGALAYGYWYLGSVGQDFYLLLALTLAFGGSALWLVLNRTTEPDILAELRLEYCEREGFCFAAAPAVENGASYLMVAYQNRYERGCQAELLFKPDPEAAGNGLKLVRTTIECGGARAGRQLIPWDIPDGLAGREATVIVGANVCYPEGRGRVVRWREGRQVGPVEAVEAGLLGVIMSSVATLRMVLPQVSPWGKLLRAQARHKPSAAAAGPAPRDGASPSPGATADREARPADVDRTGAVRPGPSARPAGGPDPGARSLVQGQAAALSEASLRGLLTLMSQGGAMKRQRGDARWAKLGLAAAQFGWGLALLLGGVAVFAFGLLAFKHGWRVPVRVFSLVVGGVGQFGGVCLMGVAIYQALESLSIRCARSAADAFQSAGEHALRSFRDDARDWTAVAEYVAYPEFPRYGCDAESGRALARRWRDLRESLAANQESLAIERIEATPHPALGPRVVELVMEVRVPDRTVLFRNAAVEVEGYWFLATLEPLVEPRGRTIGRIGRPGGSDSAARG